MDTRYEVLRHGTPIDKLRPTEVEQLAAEPIGSAHRWPIIHEVIAYREVFAVWQSPYCAV